MAVLPQFKIKPFGRRTALCRHVADGFARHRRHSAATRAAMKVWGLDTQCLDPQAHSPALTGAVMPEGLATWMIWSKVLTSW